MKYTLEMVSNGIIFVPSLMKIRNTVQAILRFRLRNMKGCNTCITDERDLRITPLRWDEMPIFMKLVSQRLFQIQISL
jgi:hypothetical protein